VLIFGAGPGSLPWFGDASLFEITTTTINSVVVIGAAWVGYWKFVGGRELRARADLTQSVKSCRLDNQRTLVQSIVAIKNTGAITLRPSAGYTKLFRIIPFDPRLANKHASGQSILGITGTEIDFPEIEKRAYPFATDGLAIDPGESTELYAEFLIAAEIKAINVYSLVSLDGRHKDIGWDASVSHDIPEQPPQTCGHTASA